MINGFYFFDWATLTAEQKQDIIEFMTSGGKKLLQQNRKTINMVKLSNFLRTNPDLVQYFVGQ
jgi:hypothetical protein